MGVRVNKVLGYGVYGDSVIPNYDREWLYQKEGIDFIEFVKSNDKQILDFFVSLTEHKDTLIPKMHLELLKVFRKNLHEPYEFLFDSEYYLPDGNTKQEIFMIQPYWENKKWKRYDDLIDYHDERASNPDFPRNSTRIVKIDGGIYPYDKKKVLLEKDDSLPDFYMTDDFRSQRGIKDEDKKKYRDYIPIEATSLLNYMGIWDKDFVNSLEPLLCVLWR